MEVFMKKKLVTLLLALACLFGLAGVTACDKESKQGESVQESSSPSDTNGDSSTSGDSSSKENPPSPLTPTEGLAYTLSADETYYIVSGIGTATDTDIVIPSTYENIPVKEIVKRAFSGCINLTSVNIPDSVQSIGNSAFRGCTNLTNLTIGNGVQTIEYDAFYGCINLASVNIPDSVQSIGDSAFAGCINLTNLTIGNGVQTIEYDAFYGCINLTSVIIPDSVQTIESGVFSGCTNLIQKENDIHYVDKWVVDCGPSVASVSLRAHTKGIAGSAFSGCHDLTSITIPDSMQSIDNDVFRDCDNLTSITVSETNEYYTSVDGNLYNKDKTTLIQYAIGKTDSTFTIPNSVQTIGNYAFYNCTNLTSVTIGSGVQSIKHHMLYACTNLTSITVSDDNAYYASQDGILYNKAKTEIIYVPKKISGAITIPDGIQTIESSAFSDCTNLTSVTIGSGVQTIGASAFNYCFNLVEVINKSQLTIEIGSTDNGYVGYYSLQVLTETPSTSNFIEQDDYVFYNANGTYYLLWYTGSSTELVLPDDINGNPYFIYQYAFQYCTNLTSVTIGSGVQSIEHHMLYGCDKLTNITVAEDNAYYASQDGILYNKEKTEIIHVPKKISGAITIPDGVQTIKSFAFEDCTNLMSITIGDGVRIIWSSAFAGCIKLVEVINKSELTIEIGSSDNGYIGYYAKQILTETPSTSNFIEQNGYIFYNDNGTYYLLGYRGTATELVLPDDINDISYSIYKYAFYNCDNLTSITVTEDNAYYTSIDGNLYNKDKTTLIQYAIGKKDSTFTIPNSIQSISEYAFACCTNLTSIIIPDSVQEIGENAFYNCTNLTNVVVGSGVQTIEYSAFYDCNNLTSVYYHGTESEWNEISTNPAWNSSLISARRYYYSETEPVGEGKYWRYVNGMPTPW